MNRWRIALLLSSFALPAGADEDDAPLPPPPGSSQQPYAPQPYYYPPPPPPVYPSSPPGYAAPPAYPSPPPGYAASPAYPPPVYPQPVYVPPVYMAPVQLVPLDQLQAQARRGRTLKRAGAALLGIGGGMLALGIITALSAGSCHHHATLAYSGSYYDSSTYYSGGCSVFETGVALGALGGVLLTAGLPVYIVGAVKVRRAERLGITAALAPTLGTTGVTGATASVGVAF